MAIKDIKSELTQLGKEIDRAKIDVASLEGRRSEIMDRLKKEFKCTSIESAEKELDNLEADLEDLEKEITDDFDALKEKFKW